MGRTDRCGEALELLRQGLSDEGVERLTLLSLLDIIELRAGLASAPALRPPEGVPQPP